MAAIMIHHNLGLALPNDKIIQSPFMIQMELTTRTNPWNSVEDKDGVSIRIVGYPKYYSKLINIFTLNFITAPLLL